MLLKRIGDTRKAVSHNMESIHLEGSANFNKNLDSSAYRSAAVQVIAKGGDVNEAQALMDAARKIEGAKVTVATTVRTNEIIYKVYEEFYILVTLFLSLEVLNIDN